MVLDFLWLKILREPELEKADQESGSGQAEFEMSVTHGLGEVRSAARYTTVEAEGGTGLET